MRASSLAVVALGGAVGTGCREVLSLAIPSPCGFPVVIVGINILGAFLLGALLEVLARRGPDEGRRRVLRLLLGTGLMGGFTTYSTLAIDTVLLTRAGAWGAGLLYSIGTLLAGALATWGGIAGAAAIHRMHTPSTPEGSAE